MSDASESGLEQTRSALIEALKRSRETHQKRRQAAEEIAVQLEKKVVQLEESLRTSEEVLANERANLSCERKKLDADLQLFKSSWEAKIGESLELEAALASEQDQRQNAEKHFQSFKSSWEKERSGIEAALASEKDKRRKAQRLIDDMLQQKALLEANLEHAQNRTLRLQQDFAPMEMRLKSLVEENARLQADVQKQQADLQWRLSCTTMSHGASWQYQVEGSWENMPPRMNEKLLPAYLAYLHKPTEETRYATLDSGGTCRIYDFEQMQQVNWETQKKRQVRIVAGVPEGWETPAASLLQQCSHLRPLYVKERDPLLLAKVQDILTEHSSGCCGHIMQRATVISMYRIENYRVWRGYKARLEALRQEHTSYKIAVTPAELNTGSSHSSIARNQCMFDCGEALAEDVDEKILLHGTTWDNADSIVMNGFDNRTCIRAMYGEGVYFASAACKSHQYTCQAHAKACFCNHERTLIIARVALGDAFYAQETRQNQRRPPVRNQKLGDTYDSIVVNPGPIKRHPHGSQIHQEFVICDKGQAYPCYVVQYKM